VHEVSHLPRVILRGCDIRPKVHFSRYANIQTCRRDKWKDKGERFSCMHCTATRYYKISLTAQWCCSITV